MIDRYNECTLCPRGCRVNRHEKLGFCGVSSNLRLASVVLHKGEEPPVSGINGSGTFFFSGCTLGCNFCQNFQISKRMEGSDISMETFVELLFKVEEEGGHNVNFVTGTQFIPSIIEGLVIARKKGFSLPAVWNTSGYETKESLELLSEHIQIFLPDLKCVDDSVSTKIFGGSNYSKIIKDSLPLMIKPMEIKNDLMISGTIIRHLVLPGYMENTHNVIKYYAENFKDRAFLSVMVQFTPPSHIKWEKNDITDSEYDKIVDWFYDYDIEEGFLQDHENERFWLPNFNNLNPFPREYSRVIWSKNMI